MKRSPLRRKTGLQSRSRLKPVSAKKRAYRASKEGKAAAEYMAAVKRLPCVITGRYGVDVHHCISGRYGTRKASDFDVIPLAPELHRYPYPDAIHTNKRAWEERYGPDYDYIDQTRRAVRAGGKDTDDA